MSIPLDVQAKLGSLGYTDVVVFAQLEESATALRASIVADLGIDPKAVNRLTFKGNLTNRSRWNELWNEVKAA